MAGKARVTVDVAQAKEQLSDVKGWLEDDDPFFAAIDDIVAARVPHLPAANVFSERKSAAAGERSTLGR